MSWEQLYDAMVVDDYPQGPDLIVNGSEIEVTIKNDGDTAVTDAFWVDVHINFSVAPTAVNQTIETLNSLGAVWWLLHLLYHLSLVSQ